MTRWRQIIPLVLILAGCDNRPPSLPPGDVVHLLVEVVGTVQVNRVGWTTFAPATVGSILRPGDVLRLDDAAQVTIVCTDLTPETLTDGFEGAPCATATDAVLHYDGDLVDPARSPPLTAPPYPILVTPRHTNLLNPHPTIRWLPGGDAEGYDVSLVGTGVSWSTRVGADTTELVYPDDAPPLQPSGNYEVDIAAGGYSSSEERDGLGFQMVSSTQAAEMHAHEETIAALGLDTAQTRMVRAHLYASAGLFADAHTELVALESDDPAVVRFVGDVYTEMLLNSLAEKNYQQARERAQATNDREGEAIAERALGQVYEATGQPSEARVHLDAAVAIYRQLGDTAMVETLEARLQRLP